MQKPASLSLTFATEEQRKCVCLAGKGESLEDPNVTKWARRELLKAAVERVPWEFMRKARELQQDGVKPVASIAERIGCSQAQANKLLWISKLPERILEDWEESTGKDGYLTVPQMYGIARSVNGDAGKQSEYEITKRRQVLKKAHGKEKQAVRHSRHG